MVRRRRAPRIGPASCVALIAVATALGPVPAATGGGFARYDAVPRVYARDPAVWADLLDRAYAETVRVALLGDSQETCPNGSGAAYIPAINYRLYELYGNCPETPIASHISTGADPRTSPAGWLWRGGSGANSGKPGGIADWYRPPGPSARVMRSIPPQAYGWFSTLNHDAMNVADTSIPNREYFDRSGEVRAEIIAMSAPLSGETMWRTRPTDTPPDPFAPVVDSGTLVLDLQSPGDPEFRSGLTAPLDFAGHEYMVLETFGTSAFDDTRLLGVRFINTSRPEGMVLQSLSSGGLSARRLLNWHGGMDQCLSVLGFDAYVIHFGANDAFSAHRTAQVFHNDLLDVIALVRTAHDDAELPILIAVDVHRAEGDPADQVHFDRYAGAAFAIAQSDDAVGLLNLRRITEEDLGWGPDDESFLRDIVHLTVDGQVALADVFVDALLAVSEPSTCPDLDGNGLVDVDDLVGVIVQWNRRDSSGDVNGDGLVDVDDLLAILLAWGSC